MTISKAKRTKFRYQIFSWWKKHRRDLPWRRTRDPYAILVSEVMLQQTQVSRVVPKYEEFLSIFPDVQILASASASRVLTVWKGLGYNRRALYLKRTAESIVRLHKGKFPNTESDLTALPGLGRYTARAILVFAYEQNVAMVDTNIRQILTQYFFRGKEQKEKIIQEAADYLLPRGKSWSWHQALMDYGALALTRTKPVKTARRPHSVPFRETRRFFRGRVIDYLREGPVGRDELIIRLSEIYQKDKEFLEGIIADLESDGLLEIHASTVQLPR